MTKEKLGYQVKGGSVSRSGKVYQLREQQVDYSAHFTHENVSLSDDHAYHWIISGVDLNEIAWSDPGPTPIYRK